MFNGIIIIKKSQKVFEKVYNDILRKGWVLTKVKGNAHFMEKKENLVNQEISVKEEVVVPKEEVVIAKAMTVEEQIKDTEARLEVTSSKQLRRRLWKKLAELKK